MLELDTTAGNLAQGFILAAGKRMHKIALPTAWRELPDGRWYRVTATAPDIVIELATVQAVTVKVP